MAREAVELVRLVAAINSEAWQTWTDAERVLVAHLYREGYSDIRRLPDGQFIGVFRMLFTHALCYGLDQTGMRGRYCYDNVVEAVTACREWDGTGHPPLNWIKHKGLGVDEGNPQQEQDDVSL